MAHLFSETIPDNVRLQFSELSGGSVDLIMDKESGIAKITLNHPEKKNALSGNLLSSSNNDFSAFTFITEITNACSSFCLF